MNKYDKIIEKVFFDNYSPEDVKVSFDREELAQACESLKFERIKNLGDILYSYRFRKNLPESIRNTARDNSEWIIISKGQAMYEFRQASPAKIEPSLNRKKIKIFDATPEIIKKYSIGMDEQALLTKVRYNRLIDIFTGLTCYSIQNHLRTTVTNVGQIEIDEIYLGINKQGVHFILPCQAKSPGDKFGIVQVMQDILFCQEKYPDLICKPIALQFLSETNIAILELMIDQENDLLRLSVVDEKNYQLVSKDELSDQEIKQRADLV